MVDVDDDGAWSTQGDVGGPSVLDETTPSVARMYDYFLGGKDNFAVDREAAAKFLTVFPATLETARANRAFLVRAVEQMCAAGIDQFIDLGAGLPTSPSVHEVARALAPDAAVVYVDNDPVVKVHHQVQMSVDSRVVHVAHDLRDPAAVLGDPAVLVVVDLDRPVGLLMIAVLHFVDPATAEAVLPRYFDALAPGSQVAVTVGTPDGMPARALAEGTAVYSRSSAPVHLRTRDEILGMLAGLEVVEPGLEVVNDAPGAPGVIGARAVKAAAAGA